MSTQQHVGGLGQNEGPAAVEAVHQRPRPGTAQQQRREGGGGRQGKQEGTVGQVQDKQDWATACVIPPEADNICETNHQR